MSVRVIGLPELQAALDAISENIEDLELITGPLARGMSKYVHRRTGYLASTIYFKGAVAGASAPYAGYEADRGGEHDFAQRSIDNWNLEQYADEIVRPF